MSILSISSSQRSFASPDGERKTIVDVPSFSLEAGQQLALHGESGAGKITFLHLIAGILAANAGSNLINGRDMASLGESDHDRLGAETGGYIFQTFNLLQGYSCLENVLLGIAFAGQAHRKHAAAMLERVGLGLVSHDPSVLAAFGDVRDFAELNLALKEVAS